MNELKMKDLTTMDFMGVNTVDGVTLTVGTKKVAEYFNKRHDDIVAMVERRLKTIDSIGESETDNFGLNFIESSYKSRGKVFKEYQLTKNGFLFIVMGLEGEEAEKIKIRYINTFDMMAELIKTRTLAKINYKGMTKALKEHYERIGVEIIWLDYAREADMINKIVLGMTSKQFKDVNGMEIHEATRDMIPQWKLNFIDKCERLNTDLLEMDMTFTEREAFLTKRYLKEVEKRMVELESRED